MHADGKYFHPNARSEIAPPRPWRPTQNAAVVGLTGAEDKITRLGPVIHFKVPFSTGVYVFLHPADVRAILIDSRDQFYTRSRNHVSVLAGDGLFSLNGESHRQHRALVKATLGRHLLSSYAPMVVESTMRTVNRWKDSQTLDIYQEMRHITQEAMVSAIFEVGPENDKHEVIAALRASLRIFERYSSLPLSEKLIALPIPSQQVLLDLPLPWNRQFHLARRRLDGAIQSYIKDCLTDVNSSGILGALIRSWAPRESSARLHQLRDEVVTLLLAGSETTAAALSWTWYLLSSSPEIESTFREEILSVLGNRLPTYADLDHLPYTNMVFAEALRLYPPAPSIARNAKKDCQIGTFNIPAQARIVVSPYLTHRDPTYYARPELFDPNRHSPAARGARPRLSYFPFGAGDRSCIGEPFAWMEATLILATIGLSWRIQQTTNHMPRANNFLVLHPRQGLPMRVEKVSPGSWV